MKKLLLTAGVFVVLIAIVVIAFVARFGPSENARRSWKDNALGRISSRLADSAWARNELARIQTTGTNDPSDSDRWLSEQLIVMRNGDWLAYASICQKEDRRLRDLFVGRGSDGQWYYSTYHFCRGMIALRVEEQPDDLSTFARTYFLRTFDGRSDESLQKTWPPDSR